MNNVTENPGPNADRYCPKCERPVIQAAINFREGVNLWKDAVVPVCATCGTELVKTVYGKE
jgi:RNase P subunit RPR2